MALKTILICSGAMLLTAGGIGAAEREITITENYLHFPVSHSVDRVHMVMEAPGMDPMPVDIRIAPGNPDYWVFKDVSALKGKKLKITYPDGTLGVNAIRQAPDIPDADRIYNEPTRPQYHFTTRRGWVNDPNGLVYYDGEYHLFYQHNPFERDWGNMTWGHAVSSDLVHWKELPTAIHPDLTGTMFSGSAVIDYDNTSGFGTKENPPMVIAYTVDSPARQDQAIAYSLDHGRTFTKYSGNPVVASKEKWDTHDTRDPRLFRYGDHWVMVLNERDGHSIYTSKNLRDWTYQSHTTGFWECPDLFELAVDGNKKNRKWVMLGASGTYMIGNFDGYKFTPLSGKHRNASGALYAAQTFNNIPANDGRRIQIAWGRLGMANEPVNGIMLMPTELTLRTTKDGIRMASQPVSEIQQLFTPVGKWTNLTQEQADKVLKPFSDDDCLRIKAVIELSHATDASLSLNGQRLFDYDMNGNRLNGNDYSPQDPTSMQLDVDIYLDRSVVEVFVEDGLLSFAFGRNTPGVNCRAEDFHFQGNRLTIKSLEVFTIRKPEVSVVSQAGEGCFPIIGQNGLKATFIVDGSEPEVVSAAAQAVADDIRLITGAAPAVQSSITGVEFPIIAGTLGQSPIIDRLAANGKIDVRDVQGKWEAYGLAVVDNPLPGVRQALVAYGSMPRSTAYALFEISRLAGVSPYVWWADVTPEKRSELYAAPGSIVVEEPSVKYRGIFINDEDWGLTPWAAKNIDSKYKNIGPNTYAKVMELLLRLRANTLWPAMHLCSQAFWDNKDNLPVAKKYDIFLGSSHCEQMLRDNEWEWRRYEDKTGTYDNWNYVTNRDKIQRYWEERVAESQGFKAMYTLGMRGVHDWGISGYPSTEDKVRGLTEIIDFQRGLIGKHIGRPDSVPQIFIPYKEVLDAYNAGLQVPEDVILTWVDDNHGYIRQLPTLKEQERSGGHGVYYHLSYWGTPADYLWICSTSPSLISYELTKGYENGIRDLWIINVGDIKPAEAELEFAMDLAWDVDKWKPENAHLYNKFWAEKTFGAELADEIASIKDEYYELGAGGKPEHIFNVRFTDEEMNQRIDRYAAIAAKVDRLAAKVPDRLKDAYFELVEYPVKGAWNMNVMTFRARQGRMAEAEAALANIDALTAKYNTGIVGGKWNGMMDSKPRQQGQFYLPKPGNPADVPTDHVAVVPAAGYKASSRPFTEFKGLGINGSSIAVWPMDYTDYSAGTPADSLANVAKAPYVDYTVPVRKGDNTIEVRFVPTFPIHSGDNLKVAVSVDGGEPQICDLRTVATQGKWNNTVLQGYNDASVSFTSAKNGNVPLRVSFLNPGLALSEIHVSSPR